MHPLASLVLGLVASFLFTIGGQVGQIGSGVLFVIGVLGAVLPIRDRDNERMGAWIVWTFGLHRPYLHTRGIREVLDAQELKAILAHELWHASHEDRYWRLVAGFIGACTVPAVAIVLLNINVRSTLAVFSLLIVSTLVVASIQARMITRSEQLADKQAIEHVGEIHLMSAKVKIHTANQEKRGLKPNEEGQSNEVLLAKYVAELGGQEAVPRLLVPQVEAIVRSWRGKDGQFEHLTIHANFLVGLIDSKRTVRELCEAAKAQRKWDEFVTIRLLCQLKERGVITT